MSGVALANAAASLIGTPFRLHGRDPLTGLDCVGVVQCALGKIGRPAVAPPDYGLRNTDNAPFLERIAQAGFACCKGPCQPGDLVTAQPGPGQLHLLIAGPQGGYIHAHAMLGRVVWTPEPLPWPASGRWRLIEN